MKQDVTADVGYAHGEIPRVELVFWPQLVGRRGTSAAQFKRRIEPELGEYVGPLEEPPFPVIHAPVEEAASAAPRSPARRPRR